MTRKTLGLFVVLLGGLSTLLAACATIMQGTSQEVSISSNPTAAQVTVDGREVGKTPIVTDLKRKDKHVIKIDLEGFQPYEVATTRSVSGWIAGNIVFGGLIGLAVDAITGGMYKIKPENVGGEMKAVAASNGGNTDILMITVVLTPRPWWEKVGQLEREAGIGFPQ